MRKGFATTLAVVGVAATVTLFALTYRTPKAVTMYQNSSEEEVEFLQFIAKYGKSYTAKAQHESRYKAFRENMQRIREENAREENAYTLGVNRFADMMEEEFVNKKVNDYKTYPVLDKDSKRLMQSDPIPIDWRERNAVTPVLNEGQCDSDYAITTVTTLESRYFIKYNTT